MMNVSYVSMITENTHIQRANMNCSSCVVNTGMIWDMSSSWKERTLILIFIQNSETSCKCKGKYVLVDNSKQILMILTHWKVIHHPYINL